MRFSDGGAAAYVRRWTSSGTRRRSWRRRSRPARAPPDVSPVARAIVLARRSSPKAPSLDIAQACTLTTHPQTSHISPRTLSWPPGVPIVPPQKTPRLYDSFSRRPSQTVHHDRDRARSAHRGRRPPGRGRRRPGERRRAPGYIGEPGGLAAPLVRRTDFDLQSRERRRRPRALGTTPGARPRPGRGRPAVRRGGRAARPERPSRLAPAVGRARRPTYARRGRRGGGAPTRSMARARPSTRGAPP